MGALFDPLLGQLRSDVAGTFSGVLPVSSGGTGSATQNFVDLSSTQSAIGGAKTFTGNTTINTSNNTAAQGALLVNNTYAVTSGNYLPIFNAFAPNAATGGHVQFRVGIAASANNSAEFNFYYAGSGSGSNNFAFGLYGSSAISFTSSAVSLLQPTTVTGNLTFSANNTYNIGDSSHYASNLYAQTVNLNSTASLSGGTAGKITVTGKLSSGGNTYIDLSSQSNNQVVIESNTTNNGGGIYAENKAVSTNLAIASFVAGFNTTVGNSSYFSVGVSLFNYNCIQVGFTYNGANSTSNTANIGMYGNNDILQIDGTGQIWLQGGTGVINIQDAKNIVLGTTTGTQIGTATSQKLSFWNKTPIIQPTTGIAAATFAANTSGTLNDSATWGGYTIGQVVQALQNVGILA
jgi:hypothetical protein